MTNIPLLFTQFRMIAIPIFFICFYLPFTWNYLLATLIFCLAALSDWLDGYLARLLKQSTRLGAFLDPVADKLLVSVALILIITEKDFSFLSIPAAVIIGREITVSALREWMAEVGKKAHIPVNLIAKIKTGCQMLALIFLLVYKPEYSIFIKVVGYILIYLATLLTLWSMFIYLKIAWPDLTLRQEKE
jgi:CDP-diacylglycerol---glycerol-3-phosphate 3-phosphatidyltransferase